MKLHSAALLFCVGALSVAMQYTNLVPKFHTPCMGLDATTETHRSNSVSTDLALTTLFFIYEDYRLNWENATLDGRVFDPTFTTFFENRNFAKHNIDYWFARNARTHPMRTMDPSEAKLFFVPVLLNQIGVLTAQYNRRPGTFCPYGSKFRNATLDCYVPDSPRHFIEEVNAGLRESYWFQRSNGTDHVLIMSQYKTNQMVEETDKILRCNTINFENLIVDAMRSNDRIRLEGIHTGNACAIVENKTYDFSMIATLNRPLAGFKYRRNICKWMKAATNASKPYSVGRCGGGAQCPTLATSRFGFHVAGDSLGSNRLFDILSSGSIPIFTDKRQYDVIPKIFPWKDVSYLVNVTDATAFEEDILRIANDDETYGKKLNLVSRTKHLWDYRQIYQFDRYMAEFARRTGLKERAM